jgi:hypothetical protein
LFEIKLKNLSSVGSVIPSRKNDFMSFWSFIAFLLPGFFPEIFISNERGCSGAEFKEV